MPNPVDEAVASTLPGLMQSNPVADFNTAAPAPAVTDVDRALAKKQREDKATVGTYAGAVLRQDDFVMGFIADLAGPKAVDQSFYPTDPKVWEELTQGIPEEYHSAFYETKSYAGALYTKSLIQDKLDDQRNLGDLGVMGNSLRFVGNFVTPGSLVMNLATLGVGSVVGGGSALYRANAAVKAAAALPMGPARTSALLNATKGLEEAVNASSLVKGTAAMAASGMVQNAGYEKLRQEYGFEKDNAMVAEAALMGLALTAPFAGVSALQMKRLRAAASQEREVLQIIQRANDHPSIPLNAVETKILAEYNVVRKHARGVQDGTVSPDAAHPLDLQVVGGKDAQPQPGKGMPEGGIKPIIKPVTRIGMQEPQRLPGVVQGGLDDLPLQGQPALPEGGIKPLFPETQIADGARLRKGQMDWSAKGMEPDAAPAVTPDATPAVTPEVAPEVGGVHASDDIGQEVFWTDPKSGEYVQGTVTGVNAQGKLMIETVDGRMAVRSKAQLDPDSPLHDTPLPDGFGPGSVGAAEVGNLPVSTLFQGIDPVYMRGGRMDISATLNRSPNPVIQELGWMLIKDAIGNSPDSPQRWTASEAKANLVRRIGGEFHTEQARALQAVQKKMGLNMWNREEVFTQVREWGTRTARGEALPANLQHLAPEVAQIAGAQRKLFATMLDEMQKAGVAGSELLQADPKYIPRGWRHDTITAALAKHGDAVYDMLANAMRGSKHVQTQAERRAAAKSFITAVQKLQYSHSLQNIDLAAKDIGTLRRELEYAKLHPHEIDAIVLHMFDVKNTAGDAGAAAGPLKFRFKLDEMHNEPMPDGSTLGIADLLENDSRVVVDRYMHSMGGHTAMAQLGIKSRSDFDGWLRNADRWHEENLGKMSADQLADGKQLAQDMYDHITGRPMSMQTFSKADRLVRGIHAYTRSAVLGQLGIAAAFEMKNAIAMSGLRAAFDQLPTFRATIKSLQSGHQASDKLAKAIHDMWAFSSEYLAVYARKHEIEDFATDGGLSRFEAVGNRASHLVDTISGNRFFTSATREMSARIVIQKYANLASNPAKLTEKLADRMVGNGVGRAAIPRVLADLQQFTVRKGNRVVELDWEGWAAHDPHTLDSFKLLVERSVREQIQAHDIGETPAWMHGTVGKIFAELRTFNLAGHAKQSMKHLHHRDATAMSALLFSIVGEALAYSLQQSMNAVNQQDLAKKLSLENISRAVVARSAILGMAPFALNMGSQVMFNQPLGQTNNTDNRNLLQPPSVALLQRGLTGITGVGTHINPFTDDTLTRGEVKGLWGMLPGSNTYGARSFIDFVTHGMPTMEPRRQ